MNDLDIIKQLEQEIGITLIKEISLDDISCAEKPAYVIDGNNNVIGLNLFEDELTHFPKKPFVK